MYFLCYLRMPAIEGSHSLLKMDMFISRAQPTLNSTKLSHVQWGIPQSRHKGSTFFPRCRCRKWRKETICHITNGAVFLTFKRTDSHTVRGRPTGKDGVVIYERLFRNGSFRELKIAKES